MEDALGAIEVTSASAFDLLGLPLQRVGERLCAESNGHFQINTADIVGKEARKSRNGRNPEKRGEFSARACIVALCFCFPASDSCGSAVASNKINPMEAQQYVEFPSPSSSHLCSLLWRHAA